MSKSKLVEFTLINGKKLTQGVDVTGYDRVFVDFAVGQDTERSSAKPFNDTILWEEMFSFTFNDDCIQKLRCLFYLTSFEDPSRMNRKIGYCTIPFRSKKFKFISGIPLTFMDYPVEGIPEGSITMSVTPKNFGARQPVNESRKRKPSNLKEILRQSMRFGSPVKVGAGDRPQGKIPLHLPQSSAKGKGAEDIEIPQVPSIEMSHGRMQRTETSMKVHDMECKIRERYGGVYTGKVAPFKKGSFYFVPHGYGFHRLPNNTMIYEGYFSKGKRNGRGKLFLQSNRLVSINGIWRNDKPLDSCKIRYPNDDIYCGTVKIVSSDLLNLNPNSFQKHGFGTFLSKEGNFFYCGQYTDDARDGIGICDYINKGERYIGLWCDDHYEGRGCYNYVDGSLYSGSYLQGKKFMDGTYYLSNGYEIKGHWTKDENVEKIELHEGKYSMISENVLQMIENELKGNLLSRRPSTNEKRSKCLWSSLLSEGQLKNQLMDYMYDQKLTQRFSKQLLYSIIEDKRGHLNEVLETFCEYFSRVNSMEETFGVQTKTIRNKLLYAKDDVSSFLEFIEDAFFETVQILAKEKKPEKPKSGYFSKAKSTRGGAASPSLHSPTNSFGNEFPGKSAATPIPQTPTTPFYDRSFGGSGSHHSMFDVVTVSIDEHVRMKEMIHSCFSDYVQRRIYPILFALYVNEYKEKEMILEQKIRAIHHALETMTKSKRVGFLIRELEEIEGRESEVHRKLEIRGLKSLILSIASDDTPSYHSSERKEEMRQNELMFLRYCMDSMSIRLLSLKEQNKHLEKEIESFSFEVIPGENEGRELIKKVEIEEEEEVFVEDDMIVEEEEVEGEEDDEEEEVKKEEQVQEKQEEQQQEEKEGEEEKKEEEEGEEKEKEGEGKEEEKIEEKEGEGEKKEGEEKEDKDEKKEEEEESETNNQQQLEEEQQQQEEEKPPKERKKVIRKKKRVVYKYNEMNNENLSQIRPDQLVNLENQLKSNRIGLFALFQTEKLNILQDLFKNIGKTNYVNFQMESFSQQVQSCLLAYNYLKGIARVKSKTGIDEVKGGTTAPPIAPPPPESWPDQHSQDMDQLKSLTLSLESLIIDFNSLSFPSYLQIAEIKKSVNQRIQSLVFSLKPFLKEDDPIFAQLEVCNKGSVSIVKRKSKKLQEIFNMMDKQFASSRISFVTERWKSIYRTQQLTFRFRYLKHQFMNIITQIQSIKSEISTCLVLKRHARLVKSILYRLSSIENDIDYVCGLDEEYLRQDRGFMDFICGLMKKRVNTIRIMLNLFIDYKAQPSKFLICFNVIHNTQMALKCLFMQMKYFNVEDEVEISLKELGIVIKRLTVDSAPYEERIRKLELGKQEVSKMELVNNSLISFQILETIKMMEIGTKSIQISLESSRIEEKIGALQNSLNVHEVSEVISNAKKKITKMAKEKKIDTVENGLQYIHPSRSTDFSQIPLKSLGANEKFIPSDTNNPYDESLEKLNELKERRSFFEKMQILNEFEVTLNTEMKHYSKKVLLEEDDILPVVLYIFLKAELNHYAEYHYLNDWKSDFNKMLMRYDVFFKYVQNLDPYARSVQGELLSVLGNILTPLKNTIFKVIKERNTKIQLRWLINLFNFIYCEIGFMGNSNKMLEINNKKLKQSIMDNFDQVQLIMSSSGKSIGFSIHIDTEFDDKLIIEFDNVYSPNIYKWCAEEILKDIKDYLT